MSVDRRLLAACDSITTLPEREALAELAAGLAPGGTLLEVGTHHGGLAGLFIAAAPACRFFTLDIKDRRTPGAPGLDAALFFCGDTAAFAAAYPDTRLDFVFIDGDHSFSGIRRDLANLAPRLAPDALLAWHDVDVWHPGVLFFVETLRRRGCFTPIRTADRLVAGRLTGDWSRLGAADFAATILAAQPVPPPPACALPPPASLLKADTSGVCIGTGSFGAIVARFSGIDPSRFHDSDTAPDDAPAYYLCSYCPDAIIRHLTTVRGIPKQRLFPIDNTYMGRLVLRDLTERNGQALLSLANDTLERDLVGRVFFETAPATLENWQRSGFLGHFVRLFWTV